MTELYTLREILRASGRIVFFGGAGVSTESGLPDFRSQDGLYNQQYDEPPEEILSHGYFLRKPEAFYRFYRDRMLKLDVQPNVTHQRLAAWEAQGRLTAVVTQNIDGLHQKAGSQRVYELHGSVLRNHCTRCGKFYDAAYILSSRGVPRCACGGVIKPDVVLYGENLDEETVTGATDAIAAADTLLVCGTSLTVYPAAGLLRYFRGRHLVLINRDATPYDGAAGLVLHESLGSVFSALPETL